MALYPKAAFDAENGRSPDLRPHVCLPIALSVTVT